MEAMPEQLLTPQELADRLGVKLSTIYHWSHIGYVPTVKLGNLIRFRWKSVSAWLEKKESKGRARRKYEIESEDLG